MNWLTEKLFGTGTKQPYLCTVTYRSADGHASQGSIALWADNLRAAVKQVYEVLPEHTDGRSVLIQLRDES